jgi:phosphatidyl-myo-inositol alpha-mannosyltransferase
MNIALTSLYLPSGSKIGVGYQVHHLANAFIRRGHDVTVFSQTGASADSLYRVEVVPPRRHIRTFFFAWDLRKIDFSRFDVLNAHGDDWFLWGTRRPRHVHTFHGSCLAETLHVPGVAGKVRMAALALCELSPLLIADELVTVSENTRRYIPGIRHVIPCGVDTHSFRPCPDNRKADHPTLLFVGTVHGRKRGRMLLDIFRRQIRPRIPDAQMWCVCDRPEGENGGGGVQWLGRVDHDTLTDLYRRAWVFCLPSTYEGFGVPYIEAMASGTPVVATPNVGAREVTMDGSFGLLPADRDLGPTLVRLLSDSNERLRLRNGGLHRAQDFSWDTVCAQYEALYERPAPVSHARAS